MLSTREKNECLEVRLMRRDEEASLVEFYSANQQARRKFYELWEWRKKAASHRETGLAVIAKDKETVVGSVGLVPACVTLGGSRIRGCWQQDSLVSSNMRGKGVGRKLIEEGNRSHSLTLAKGSNEGMYRLRKSLGYVDVGKSDYLLRVCRPRLTDHSLKRRIFERSLACWKRMVPLPRIDSSLTVEKVDYFDESFDWLAEQLSKELVLRIHKNQSYLNWRYFQYPSKEYIVLRAGEEQARGALVLNITGDSTDEGWIVDLICLERDRACAYALLNYGVKILEEKKVSRVWVFSTLVSARRWLIRFGFLPTRITPRFTYKLNSEKALSDSVSKAPWDFWHGDGDIELYM